MPEGEARKKMLIALRDASCQRESKKKDAIHPAGCILLERKARKRCKACQRCQSFHLQKKKARKKMPGPPRVAESPMKAGTPVNKLRVGACKQMHICVRAHSAQAELY